MIKPLNGSYVIIHFILLYMNCILVIRHPNNSHIGDHNMLVKTNNT